MIYSTLFAAGNFAGAGDTLVYTAPAVNTIVLRDVVLGITAAGATNVQVYGQVSGPGDRADVLSTPTPVARTTYALECRQVLRPGEQIYVHSDSGAVRFRLSGYVLV